MSTTNYFYVHTGSAVTFTLECIRNSKESVKDSNRVLIWYAATTFNKKIISFFFQFVVSSWQSVLRFSHS